VSILSAGTSPQALLSRVLTASGVGRVLPFDSSMTSVVAAGAHSAAPRLVISWGAGDASQQRRELALDQWCQKAEVPWLRVTYRPREGRADIGPLFHRGPFPCCHCFHATQGNSAEDVDSSEGVSGDAAVWIGLAAFEATCILSRTAGALNGGGFRRYDVRTGERAEMSWCRVPGCPRCLPLRPANRSIVNAAEPRVHTPIAFEDAVAFHPSTEAISRTRRRVMADVEHGRYLKRLAVCRSLALPRAMPDMPFGISRALRGEMQPSDGRFGIEQLSTALRVTAGLRQFQQTDGPVSRWAPSAGNLGSPELFVAVRNIDGLPAGLYYYDAQDHSLTSLTRRHGGLLPDDLMARVLRRESDLPEALVIFTGAFHRIARKYGAFAYRLMHLDAGAAAVQLEVAAAALGAHSRVSAIWPDDLLQEQLQLQPIQEQVTAVVSLAARPLSQMRVGTSFAFGSIGQAHHGLRQLECRRRTGMPRRGKPGERGDPAAQGYRMHGQPATTSRSDRPRIRWRDLATAAVDESLQPGSDSDRHSRGANSRRGRLRRAIPLERRTKPDVPGSELRHDRSDGVSFRSPIETARARGRRRLAAGSS
jgi:SagB-type dehydrogenase family enzyme